MKYVTKQKCSKCKKFMEIKNKGGINCPECKTWNKVKLAKGGED